MPAGLDTSNPLSYELEVMTIVNNEGDGFDIREIFVNALEHEQFSTDKTGCKTIEIIGASFLADEPAIFGKPNQEYIDAEIEWYASESTNITDIYPDGDKEPPQAWQYTANIHGEINSNYGHLI